MTSQGSPYSILRRALERGGSLLQIRAAAADLPQIGLEDALAICLAYLDQEPENYARAAAKWARRVGAERDAGEAEAQLLAAALATLPGPGARAGAEALIELAELYGLRRVDELLGRWLQRRGLND